MIIMKTLKFNAEMYLTELEKKNSPDVGQSVVYGLD